MNMIIILLLRVECGFNFVVFFLFFFFTSFTDISISCIKDCIGLYPVQLDLMADRALLKGSFTYDGNSREVSHSRKSLNGFAMSVSFCPGYCCIPIQIRASSWNDS